MDFEQGTGATACVICAWRENCNKKFSMEGSKGTRCPEFSRDVTIKIEPKKKDDESGEK